MVIVRDTVNDRLLLNPKNFVKGSPNRPVVLHPYPLRYREPNQVVASELMTNGAENFSSDVHGSEDVVSVK